MNNKFPIIWRSPESEFNNDEPLNARVHYTLKTLSEIKQNGFNAIWLRGKLWELGHSTKYHELNDASAAQRIQSLQKVIADAASLAMKVYLYFNEPLALPTNHPFWQSHPEMMGEPYTNYDSNETSLAFCTASPKFRPLFEAAIGNLYDDLPRLGGVILITASEYHTHCWAHKSKIKTGDHHMDAGLNPLECSRCAKREPADIVAELVTIWKQLADNQLNPPEVWAWNWSWARWYPQPQAEVISKLPAGVKLMGDFERGSIRKQQIGDVFIDEYSLGFVGPSERFTGSKQATDKQNISICAKLQIGVTHELATVPNIPLIGNLYDKLLKIDELGIEGLMCSWNFGNTLTANTAIFGFFYSLTPAERRNREHALSSFVTTYFGISNKTKVDNIMLAWEKFAESFHEYPFSIPMLYYSPINYAPALPLSLHYEGREMGPSWVAHEPFGEQMANCLSPFSIEQVIQCYSLMSCSWTEGLELFTSALGSQGHTSAIDFNAVTATHCFEELSCAKMISCHIDAMVTITKFQKWRDGKLSELKLTPPCDLPPDNEALELIAAHAKIAARAAEIMKFDSRLGYHQEPHHQFFDAETLSHIQA